MSHLDETIGSELSHFQEEASIQCQEAVRHLELRHAAPQENKPKMLLEALTSSV